MPCWLAVPPDKFCKAIWRVKESRKDSNYAKGKHANIAHLTEPPTPPADQGNPADEQWQQP